MFEDLGVPFQGVIFFYMQLINIECKWKLSSSLALLSRDCSKYQFMIISEFFRMFFED